MSAHAITQDAKGSTAARWLNNILVVGIGIALALLTLKLIPRDAPAPLPAVVAVKSNGAEVSSPASMANDIASHHLFGDASAQPVVETVSEKPKNIEETRLNLQLAGVFAFNPQERATAIISAGSGEQNAYGIGDKVSGETTLQEVYPDHVVLNNRGKLEKLMLPEDVQPIAMSSVAPSSDSGISQDQGIEEDPNAPVELPENPGELRDTLARNPAMLGRVVSAEPYQENGKLLGYRIMPKQNPEILEAQGILAGDVITRVNNIDLNSQKQGIRALRNAVKAESLDITILRDGVEVPVSISLTQ